MLRTMKRYAFSKDPLVHNYNFEFCVDFLSENSCVLLSSNAGLEHTTMRTNPYIVGLLLSPPGETYVIEQ